MHAVTRRRTVDAKQQRIWDVLADFGAISRWVSFVDHSCLLHDRPLEVGSTRRIQTGRMTVLERIVELDEPHGFTYDIEGLPSRVRQLSNRWQLAPAGETATEVAVTTKVITGPRPPQQLAERIVARVLASRSDAMLDGLAAHVEEVSV